VLGYMGAMPAEGMYLLISRVATAYYFIHFIIVMPLLGYMEKTKPVPLSIADPIISSGSGNLAAAKKDKTLI